MPNWPNITNLPVLLEFLPNKRPTNNLTLPILTNPNKNPGFHNRLNPLNILQPRNKNTIINLYSFLQ